jgi:hypothetical protein
MAHQRPVARAAVSEEEASFQILDEWLRIETEHTDSGFVLPSRLDVVAWIEAHAVPVLIGATLVVCAPVIGALTFG